MSDYLAVDIVILPPSEVMDKAIALNKEYESHFILNKNDRLPHITLMQAVVKKSDLEKAEIKLKAIANSFKPLKLSANIVKTPAFTLEIQKTLQLNNLHVTVMDEFKDLVSYVARADQFYDEIVNDGAVVWVKNFLVNSAYDKYHPHITFTTSEPADLEESMEFTANRRAICHLGSYGTCRKILFETKLGLTPASGSS